MRRFSKSRRHVLTGIAGSTAAALAAPSALRAHTGFSPSAQLANYCSNRHSAAEVGRQYLRTNPGEADVNTLMQLLQAGDVQLSSRAELDAFVRQSVRADFSTGRVVTVQRWMLSFTEARLCALAALI